MAESIALERGLSEAEAARRLAREGPNLFGVRPGRTLPGVALRTLREPMFLLRLTAAALYLAFGKLGEGLFLLGGACVSIGLVVGQEYRSERALQALSALAAPLAQVIRDGELRTIPAASLVPGDALVIGAGGRIPADAVLLRGDALTVDESALTGEAAPVIKCAATSLSDVAEEPVPGGDGGPNLFAGTMIASGEGVAFVMRTGARTHFGRIGDSLAGVREEPTLLQRNVGRLVRRLGLLAMVVCVVLVLAYGALRGDWYLGALAGLTLAISLLPEEFPMVLAVFMALGAWRLARRNVIVRRSAVIETLGATTLLLVDKTGTLTENRMRLAGVWRSGSAFAVEGSLIPEGAEDVVAAALLASAIHPHDPMDAALQRSGVAPPQAIPLRSYPLRPGFLAFVQVWRDAVEDGVVYAAKGAHETILNLCSLPEAVRRQAEAAAESMAARGMRVLGVAEARFDTDPDVDPEAPTYRFQGLLGFADPVRQDVRAALDEAGRAGIAVAMITGDYPATALAVARAAGIDTKAGLLTGTDIAAGAARAERLADVRIFARIMPEQKLELVEGFKAAGHVVAMTGDGINDAPALAAAHVGIAMGKRGTDVAREASDLVLLDDSFGSIVAGIRLGRRIFANLRRAMVFITAIHVPIAGLALLPILMGLPPLLFPMHVVILELLIDPLCSLVFEAEQSEEAAMARPPRPAGESLFGAQDIARALVRGAVLLAVILGIYAGLIASAAPEGAARAMAFTALVAGDLAMALAGTSSDAPSLFDRRRLAFWLIAAAALVVMALCLTMPALRTILRFSALSIPQLGFCLLMGLIGGAWFRPVAALVHRLRRRGSLSLPDEQMRAPGPSNASLRTNT